MLTARMNTTQTALVCRNMTAPAAASAAQWYRRLPAACTAAALGQSDGHRLRVRPAAQPIVQEWRFGCTQMCAPASACSQTLLGECLDSHHGLLTGCLDIAASAEQPKQQARSRSIAYARGRDRAGPRWLGL